MPLGSNPPVLFTHVHRVSCQSGCWRDPLPFVARTARKLVSRLAVLFHSLAEDVRIMAESAGLEWRWREVDGVVVDEGVWEGSCDMVRTEGHADPLVTLFTLTRPNGEFNMIL